MGFDSLDVLKVIFLSEQRNRIYSSLVSHCLIFCFNVYWFLFLYLNKLIFSFSTLNFFLFNHVVTITYCFRGADGYKWVDHTIYGGYWWYRRPIKRILRHWRYYFDQ